MIKQQLSKFSVTTALLSSTMALMSVSTNIPTVSADDTITPIDDTITITVDSACTMGQTVLQSSNTLNPGETSTIGGSRIAAYCNDSEGYAIYAIGYTNGEYGNTNLVSTQNPSHIIPTGISGTNSYWNMKLTGGTATGPVSYQPTMVNTFTTNTNIPNDYTKVAYRDSSTISQTEDPAETGSYFTTAYETHLSTTQPAGIYNGQVQYVMVHPSSAPAPEIPTMQDVATIKAKLTNVGDTMQAADNRDGKKYWITKLADGNIWMTQNLDLQKEDLKAGVTLDSTNTDHPASGFVLPDSQTSGNTSWGSDEAAINTAHVFSLSDQSGYTATELGNYYNWYSATAGTGTYSLRNGQATGSICPAGWRLPNNATSGFTATDWSTLLKEYGVISSATVPYTVDQEKLSAAFESPLSLVRAGSYSGGVRNVGAGGFLWSSMANLNKYARNLNFGGGNVDSWSDSDKYQGFSVRCLAE